MPHQSTSKCRHFGSRPSLTGHGSRAGSDVKSRTRFHGSSHMFTYLLVFVGKAEKVARKIASQERCKGDVATQQTYRRYHASSHTDFV